MLTNIVKYLIENTGIDEDFLNGIMAACIIYLVFSDILVLVHYAAVGGTYLWMKFALYSSLYFAIVGAVVLLVSLYLDYVYGGKEENRPFSDRTMQEVVCWITLVGMILTLSTLFVTLYAMHWLALATPLFIVITTALIITVAVVHKKHVRNKE